MSLQPLEFIDSKLSNELISGNFLNIFSKITESASQKNIICLMKVLYVVFIYAEYFEKSNEIFL